MSQAEMVWTNDFYICYSQTQVYDILVVNQNYSGDGTAGSLTLRRGDLVEVLNMEQKHSNGSVNGADSTLKK